MATWVVGDVHGCAHTLDALLSELALAARTDSLVFVGDVVNRGLHSSAVLDTIEQLGDAATVVLGNHEVHLLGRAFGISEARRGDTLDHVLASPRAADWVDRLRASPLVHHVPGARVVHAGVAPSWSEADTDAYASSVEAALRGDRCTDVLRANMASRLAPPAPAEPPPRRDESPPAEELASYMAILTRIRMIRPTGDPDAAFKGSPADAPPALTPWFEARPAAERRWIDRKSVV